MNNDYDLKRTAIWVGIGFVVMYFLAGITYEPRVK